MSRLMAPAGTAEQDALPTDWVMAKIGRVAFLLTNIDEPLVQGVATGRGISIAVTYPFH